MDKSNIGVATQLRTRDHDNLHFISKQMCNKNYNNFKIDSVIQQIQQYTEMT